MARPTKPRCTLAIATATVLVVAGAAQRCILIWSWVRPWTNEDLTLLWAAARDWGAGHARQPNFWGQSYGTTLEGLPTEALRWVGIGYPTGLPIVISAAHLLMWWIPAAAAWRRGHRFSCCLALAAPLVLSDEYLIITSVYSAVAGRVIASLALAIVILADRRVGRVAVACGLAALAFQFDSSTLLVTLPACGYALVAIRRDLWGRGALRRYGIIGVCLLPSVVWQIFTSRWYRRHPEDALHPAPALRPSTRILMANVRAPGRLFTMFSPELLRSPILVLSLAIVIVVAVLATGRAPQVVAGCAFPLVLVMAMALPKSQDQLATVYFPAARTIAVLPLALWFLVLIGPRPRRRVPLVPAFAALLAVVAVTSAVRVYTWSERGGAELASAVAFPSYPLTRNTDLVGRCARVRAAAETTNTSIAIFVDRTAAYGCAGLIGDEVTTAFPPYERRSWVLKELDKVGADRMMLVGAVAEICANSGLHCAQFDPDIVLIQLDGSTPLDAVRELGIAVRPF